MLLGPAGVHAHEHLGPVAGVGAAGAGLDAEKGVGPVLRAGHHRLEFECLEPRLGLGQFRFELGLEAGILVGQFGHRLEVVDAGGQFLVRLDAGR